MPRSIAKRHQLGLHTVVQITFDTAALCIGDVDRGVAADGQRFDALPQLGSRRPAQQALDQAPVHRRQTSDDVRRGDQRQHTDDERAEM